MSIPELNARKYAVTFFDGLKVSPTQADITTGTMATKDQKAASVSDPLKTDPLKTISDPFKTIPARQSSLVNSFKA